MPNHNQVKQCAILVGGLGTRLGDLTTHTPKPLLPCGDRPFLAWILRELIRFGIDDIVLLTGHLSDQVRGSLPQLVNSLPRKIQVSVSEEPVRAGTGGALYHARDYLHDQFLLLNGDSLLDGAIGELLSDRRFGEDTVGHIMLRDAADASRFGTVSLQGGKILEFNERPKPGAAGLINGGVYLFDKRIPEYLSPVCSLERDVLPLLASRGLLGGTVGKGYFIDIGVPDDFQRAQTEVPLHLRRPALLLDRDGVINIDHGWVGSRDRFEWITGAREAIAFATKSGWHVFVVTNQSGVARGLYNEEAVADLHEFIRQEVQKLGGTVDDVRYCPHHPEGRMEAYRIHCGCRKPAPGMIDSLKRTWELDEARCCFVGDKETDLQAAYRASISGHLFTGGDLEVFVKSIITAN